MPLFRRHHGLSMHDIEVPVPGLADLAAARAWQAVAGEPFDGHFGDAVHDTVCTMHGFPPGMTVNERNLVRIDRTLFRDTYRFDVDGRRVVVANAWTNIRGITRYEPDDMKGAGVCAVEMPTMLAIACVQPRRFRPMMPLRATPTGDAGFDGGYTVFGAPGADQQILTPEVRKLIAARDDWAFRAERYLFGCVQLRAFDSADAVTQLIDEVLQVVTAFPTAVVPDHVDHTADDLIDRATRLTSLPEALAFLQGLTDDERQRLAASDSPFAAMADVQTPEEAMERFKSLDTDTKMQLAAQVMRVKDDQRRK